VRGAEEKGKASCRKYTPTGKRKRKVRAYVRAKILSGDEKDHQKKDNQ